MNKATCSEYLLTWGTQLIIVYGTNFTKVNFIFLLIYSFDVAKAK